MVDFKNTVIIMTTNLGTRDISKSVATGFQSGTDTQTGHNRMRARVTEELKQHFRPEFLNRVDDVVVFPQLTQDEIIEIIEIIEIMDMFVGRLEKRLKDKDMGIELTPAAKILLATRGYDPATPCRQRADSRNRRPRSETAGITVVGCVRTGREGRGVPADSVEEFCDIHSAGGRRSDRRNPGCHGAAHRLDERGAGLVGPHFDQFHFAGGDMDGSEAFFQEFLRMCWSSQMRPPGRVTRAGSGSHAAYSYVGGGAGGGTRVMTGPARAGLQARTTQSNAGRRAPGTGRDRVSAEWTCRPACRAHEATSVLSCSTEVSHVPDMPSRGSAGSWPASLPAPSHGHCRCTSGSRLPRSRGTRSLRARIASMQAVPCRPCSWPVPVRAQRSCLRGPAGWAVAVREGDGPAGGDDGGGSGQYRRGQPGRVRAGRGKCRDVEQKEGRASESR